ncbi:MAG: hypothetical protein WBN01_02425 [Polyangiales bacterium]
MEDQTGNGGMERGEGRRTTPLPLEHYREVLGDKAPKSDAELRKLREEVYRLARAVVQTVIEERKR